MVNFKRIEAHYGNDGAGIMRAMSDLHANGKRAQVFSVLRINGNEPGIFDRVWKALRRMAASVFESAGLLLSAVPWEVLINIKDAPNYLSSLLKIINQLLAEQAQGTIIALANAFFVGSTKLWDFLASLFESVEQTEEDVELFRNMKEQVQQFGTMLKEYGASIVGAVKYLFTGIKSIVSKIVSMYGTAVEKLSEFSSSFINSMLLVPRMGSVLIQTVHEKSIQLVILGFILMQNVLELARVGSNVAKAYVEQYAAKLNAMTNDVRRLVDSLSAEAVFKRVFNVLLSSETVKGLVKYIKSSRVVVVLDRIFAFIANIITNVTVTLGTYITNFVSRCTNKFSDIMDAVLQSVGGLSPQQEIFNLSKACDDWAQNPKISEQSRAELIDASNGAKKIIQALSNFSDSKYQRLGQLFDNASFASRVLTDTYFDREVSKKDEDRLCRDSTGFDFETFTNLIFTNAQLMRVRIAAASAQFRMANRHVKMETRLPEEFIGVRDDEEDNRNKEIHQKRAEIEENKARMKEILAEIAHIKLTNGDFEKANERTVEFFDAQIFNSSLTSAQRSVLGLEKLAMLESNRVVAGITALEKEYAELQQANREKDSSISKTQGWVRRNAGKMFVLLMVVGVTVAAKWFYDMQTRNSHIAMQTLFRPLLKEANQDPFLAMQIKDFVETRGISFLEASPEVITELQVHISKTIAEIDSGTSRIDIDVWYPFMLESISMHQARAMEAKKPVAPSVASRALNAVWGLLSKQATSLQIDPGEQAAVKAAQEAQENSDAVNAVVFSSGQAALDMIQNMDPAAFRKGWRAYEGSSMEEKKRNFAMDFALVASSHFKASAILLAHEKTRLSAELDAAGGFMSQFVKILKFGATHTGLLGADKDAGLVQVQESMAMGSGLYLTQQFAYYEGNLMLMACGVRLITVTVMTFCNVMMNIIAGEMRIASDLADAVTSELVRVLGLAAASVIGNAIFIFTGRFALPVLIFKIAVSLTPWELVKRGLRVAKSWCCCPCGRRVSPNNADIAYHGRHAGPKAQSERDNAAAAAGLNLHQEGPVDEKTKKLQARICDTCTIGQAVGHCGHCADKHYCSDGCADIDWSRHAFK